MSGLLELLKDLIEMNGSITVADYMRVALQHPNLGYYREGDPIGHGGDFITAPEISQMFGEMIGLWCAEIWHRLGSPPSFVLLELGPGHGTLMQDALRATAKVPGFHQAMKLYLLESNRTLRKLQNEKLATFAPEHISVIEDLPVLPVIALANEFFDALPIRQFEKSFQGWCERRIGWFQDGLAFTLSSPDEALKLLIPDNLQDAKPGAMFELSPAALRMMRDLALLIKERQGALLAIDYGYAVADGAPTLQAVKGHAYADVLKDPGQADITALVDFSSLRRAALLQDVAVAGPVGQGDFLCSLGIERRAAQLKQHATAEQSSAIDGAYQRLTAPAQMGNLFKVLAASSLPPDQLPGF